MCFIAACNPYRIFTNILSNEIGLDFKNNSASRNLYENLNSIRDLNQALAYKVNSLPFSLLNYVFDFGSLSKKDELNYIESMIRKNFLDEKIKINQDGKIIEIIKNLIFSSQEFIREQNTEISSVSLRDVRRFIIFFRWFRLSIAKRAEFESSIYEKFKDARNLDDLLLHSSILSILLIYYLRIPNKLIKKKFI